MDSLACPVLTYHSQNVFANHYGRNDHLTLAADLTAIQAAGQRVVPLNWLVDCLLQRRPTTDLKDAVCITFDDGCNPEVFDLDFPEHGLQPSFRTILEQFRAKYRDQGQADLQATTFVIASEQVRQQIDREALFGQNWMSDDWWSAIQRSGLIDIQNHGWDHKHPSQSVDPSSDPDPEQLHARFKLVTTTAECDLQVRQAAEFIAAKAQRTAPQYFAYPYGQPSDYIRLNYFPAHADELGLEAAFSTTPAHVSQLSDRWALPRYVCGRDWQTPERFAQILTGDWVA